MLNAKDLELLAAKGISEKQIEEQLACFVKGFPFLEITASASVERGIMVIPQEKQATYMDAWDAYLAKNKKITGYLCSVFAGVMAVAMIFNIIWMWFL